MQPSACPEEALVEAAEAAARGARWGEALELLERALRVRPDFERARLKKCELLRALGRRAEALSCAEALTRAHPVSAPVHHELGLCLSSAGRHSEAVEAFKRALELDPRMLHSWKGMGIALGRMGRLEEAFRCYERASGRTPELSVPSSITIAESDFERAVHELMTGLSEGGGGCARVEADPTLTFRASVSLLALLLTEYDMDGVVVSMGRPAEVYRRALAARAHTPHPPYYVEVLAGPGSQADGRGGADATTLSAFEPHRIDAAVRAGLQKEAEMYGGEEHFVLIDGLTTMEFYNGRDVVRRFLTGFIGELASLSIFCFVVVPASRAGELLGPLPIYCRQRIRIGRELLR
ncbi:MAG: tetratricopeptide repeat protein [Thermoplasmatota archaeon]